MKKVKLPASKAKRIRRELRNGPWHGKVVLVPPAGTMVFTISGQRGYYDHKGIWKVAV